MLRTVSRLPAVLVAAVLSALVLLAAPSGALGSPRATNAAPSSLDGSGAGGDRVQGAAKAVVQKADLGTRAHGDHQGLGPDTTGLPITWPDVFASVGAGQTSGADATSTGLVHDHVQGRAPPR